VRRSSTNSTTGSSCGWRPRRSRTAHCATWISIWRRSRPTRPQPVRWCTGRATPPRPTASSVGLVRAVGAEEVVKVKSMATQEIELNEALADAGIDAWETDLAELIVQLGDDWPSHILVPAIHRNRSEVREIFLRRMKEVGRPAPEDLTDEPKRLAEAARLHLREKFLRAKVAVSGANFAIADTGS